MAVSASTTNGKIVWLTSLQPIKGVGQNSLRAWDQLHTHQTEEIAAFHRLLMLLLRPYELLESPQLIIQRASYRKSVPVMSRACIKVFTDS